jgi:toxin ParE1/3/4
MMQNLPVIYREEAIADIEQIVGYLRDQGASLMAAHAFVDRMEARCQRIGGVPEGNPLRPDLGPGIRLAPFERSAIILYCLTDAAVEIVRIYYGGRDYQSLLGDKRD